MMKSLFNKRKVSFICLSLILFSCATIADEARWWPVQKKPKAIVKTVPHREFEKTIGPDGKTTAGDLGATHIMIQSLAGLAAQAVNEGLDDEMIWIQVGKTGDLLCDYQKSFQGMMQRLELEDRGSFASWGLVKRFLDKGLINGYILYRYDFSKGDAYAIREDADQSVNVATTIAGIEKALLIEESQQEQAEKLGLEMILDSRDKTTGWCFNKYKDQLNKDFIAIIDPKVAHCRDFAIAYKCYTVFGDDEPVHKALAWLNPLSMVIGWNWGDEGHNTKMFSSYGHFQSASNWSLNIPLLSILTESKPMSKYSPPDPAKIDFENTKYAASFIMSDGDNLQWYMGGFICNQMYWANEYNGDFPFGWTSCTANLAQASPDTLEIILKTRSANSSLIEFGGGYHYPDIVGLKRNNRDEILTAHARRIWKQMEKFGLNIFGFICMDLDSEASKNAYEIYAREMPGLVGMIAIQYYPYEEGGGKIYWVKNSKGIEIPVITAKYALWSNSTRPMAGTPVKISQLINKSASDAQKHGNKSFDWVIVHAWSSFKKTEESDENAGNAHFLQNDSKAGITPTQWCIDRLDKKIKVVSPEELIWHIRMEHNPVQTKKVIGDMKK